MWEFFILYLCFFTSLLLSAVTFDRSLWLSVWFYRVFVWFGILNVMAFSVLVLSKLVMWIGG